MTSTLFSAAGWLRWAAAPLALVGSSLLVWQASTAAFSATTDNGANNWTAGTVALSDNDSGTAMFTATGLKPADSGTRCITVTYNGSLAAAVKLHATASGTLGSHLTLTVEQGSGNAPAACTGFVSESTIYSGTVAGLASTASTFGTGVGSFAPTAAGQTKSYRFVYTVQDNQAAQGTTASATFTWEAQNS